MALDLIFVNCYIFASQGHITLLAQYNTMSLFGVVVPALVKTELMNV